MSSEFVIVDAEERDIEYVGSHMRREHMDEVAGMLNLSPEDAVRRSVSDSTRVFAGRGDGETLLLCGVGKTPILSDTGSVWMLATPEIDRYALSAAIGLRALFGQAHEMAGAPVLEQFLPPWYRKGIKWLLWLGWKAMGVRPINGSPHVRMIHEEGSQR